MAQNTMQFTDRTSFNPLNYSQISAQPQIRTSRYSGVHTQQQQPDQSPGAIQTIKVSNKDQYNVTEVPQGLKELKELQEMLDGALKRSNTPVKVHASVSATSRAPAAKPVEVKTETVKNSSEMSVRSNVSSVASQSATVRYAQSEITASPSFGREQVENYSYYTPQSSARFYLGGLNSSLVQKEELLNSINSYKVKTLNDLKNLQTPQTYAQQGSQKKSESVLGSSLSMSNMSFVPIEGYQPSYDTQKLDQVISRIVSGHQSFSSVRTESFMASPSSHLTTRLFDTNTTTQEYVRQTPQQQKHARPVQSTSSKVAQASTKKAVVEEKPKKSKGESCCGEVFADGDSMILDFIKGNDQLLDFDDEEVKPAAKRARVVYEADEEKPEPKKLSKRQEILNSKRQMKNNTKKEGASNVQKNKK